MADTSHPVYQLINGELVRKPGDLRDPSRRYGIVVNVATGESYTKEFTVEEEQQADENADQWAAEEPIREAERQGQLEEAEKFRDSLIYENRVVAFLDILGWSQAIEDSEKPEHAELAKHLGVSLRNIEVFSQFVDSTRQMFGSPTPFGDQQITHFSDSILISVKADADSQDNLLRLLSPVVSQLLSLGHFVRGGIACGNLIHRGSIAYGPAFIKAYKLEEQAAVYPRIILEPALAGVWGQGKRYYRDDQNLLLTDKTWRQDSDGFRFYDFLQPSLAGHFADSSHEIQHASNILTNIRPKISAGIQQFSSRPKELMKYDWLVGYFNDVVDEYPETLVEKISF